MGGRVHTRKCTHSLPPSPPRCDNINVINPSVKTLATKKIQLSLLQSGFITTQFSYKNNPTLKYLSAVAFIQSSYTDCTSHAFLRLPFGPLLRGYCTGLSGLQTRVLPAQIYAHGKQISALLMVTVSILRHLKLCRKINRFSRLRTLRLCALLPQELLATVHPQVRHRGNHSPPFSSSVPAASSSFQGVFHLYSSWWFTKPF